MAVRTLRHLIGIDRLEEQLRSEAVRKDGCIQDVSETLALQDKEFKQIQLEMETKAAFVKGLPRQHGIEEPAEGLRALRDAVTTVHVRVVLWVW